MWPLFFPPLYPFKVTLISLLILHLSSFFYSHKTAQIDRPFISIFLYKYLSSHPRSGFYLSPLSQIYISLLVFPAFPSVPVFLRRFQRFYSDHLLRIYPLTFQVTLFTLPPSLVLLFFDKHPFLPMAPRKNNSRPPPAASGHPTPSLHSPISHRTRSSSTASS